MKVLWSIVFGFCLFLCQAQEGIAKKIDSIKNGKDELSLKVKLFEEMIPTIEQRDSLNLGILYHELALVHYKDKNFLESLEIIKNTLVFKEPIRNTDPTSFQKSLNLLSAAYGKVENPGKRIETLYRILAEKQQTKFTVSSWRRLAPHMYEVGDYFKSIEYANRVIDSYENHQNGGYYVQSLLDIINAYAGMKSNNPELLPEIEQYKLLLEEVLDALYLDEKLEYYNSLGLIYRTYNQKELALASYQKALPIALDLKDEESLHNLYVNLGEMYSQMDESKKANEYYQKILSTKDSINISAVYNNIGYYHATSVEEEIELHQKAIQILERESGFSNALFFPEDIIESDLKEEFLSVFVDLSLAWIKKFKQTQQQADLEEALKLFYRIDNLISVIRLNSQTKTSKLFWIDRGVNSYLEAVKVCFLLDRPQEAFYFMEKNKSLYLLEQLSRLQLRSEYKVPEALLEKSKHLQYLLLQKKHQLTQNPKDASLQKSFKEASFQYQSFADSLVVEFPSFYQSSLNLDLISLDEFQTFLQEQNAQATSYIMGANEGYGLWIDGTETHFYQLDEYSKLKVNIGFLRKVFTNPLLSIEQVEAYKEKGYEVFKTLFPVENAVEKIESQSLKILPSGDLYGFPFEALLVDQKPILKENYLIHHAEITYLNSATVSQSLYQKNLSSSYSYLGIAPVEFQSEKLIGLRDSEKVVNEVASLFSSKVFLNKQATKQEFFKVSKPAILHINTHAGIDNANQQLWLSMQDSLVYLEELYLKSQPHDLVFLDACKTADGTLQRGEGIESLSRAFFHTGSKSIIASNWNANEKVTNEISVSFFKELKNGTTKSAALRQAKLTYLENSQLSDASPYFWASLTLTGDSNPVSFPSYEIYYWFIGGAILLFIFFLFRNRRKQTS